MSNNRPIIRYAEVECPLCGGITRVNASVNVEILYQVLGMIYKWNTCGKDPSGWCCAECYSTQILNVTREQNEVIIPKPEYTATYQSENYLVETVYDRPHDENDFRPEVNAYLIKEGTEAKVSIWHKPSGELIFRWVKSDVFPYCPIGYRLMILEAEEWEYPRMLNGHMRLERDIVEYCRKYNYDPKAMLPMLPHLSKQAPAVIDQHFLEIHGYAYDTWEIDEANQEIEGFIGHVEKDTQMSYLFGISEYLEDYADEDEVLFLPVWEELLPRTTPYPPMKLAQDIHRQNGYLPDGTVVEVKAEVKYENMPMCFYVWGKNPDGKLVGMTVMWFELKPLDEDDATDDEGVPA